MSSFYWDTDPEVRTKHLYIPGQPGYGKTSLMANLALDDIKARKGPVIVIDPKGSKQGLVERIIPHIPEHILPDVFYVSLRHPTPIDFLSFRDQFEKNLIRGDIISILQRFVSFGSWGSTMQGILNDLIPTLLEVKDTTFLDIGRFLDTKSRREAILAHASPERKQWWEENRSLLKEGGPIVTRMSNFKEPPLKTIIDCRRDEGISVAEIIENNQILLVDTSPLGSDGLMLGALIMSRIQQAIFRRSPDEHHPLCTVYADEFHNFQTSGFSEMLTQARSFNLSLCLANQHPKQIKDIWDDVKGISTYAIFRLDGEHAAMLRSKIKEPAPEPYHLIGDDARRNIETLKVIEDSYAEQITRSEKIEQLTKTPNTSLVELRASFCENALQREELERYLQEDPRAQLPQKIPLPQKSIFDQIPSLPVGKVVFIDHTGKTSIIKLRQPPPPGSRSDILTTLVAQTAQIGQKRTVDTPSCNSIHISHDERNGSKEEEIAPSGRAHIPVE